MQGAAGAEIQRGGVGALRRDALERSTRRDAEADLPLDLLMAAVAEAGVRSRWQLSLAAVPLRAAAGVFRRIAAMPGEASAGGEPCGHGGLCDASGTVTVPRSHGAGVRAAAVQCCLLPAVAAVFGVAAGRMAADRGRASCGAVMARRGAFECLAVAFAEMDYAGRFRRGPGVPLEAWMLILVRRGQAGGRRRTGRRQPAGCALQRDCMARREPSILTEGFVTPPKRRGYSDSGHKNCVPQYWGHRCNGTREGWIGRWAKDMLCLIEDEPNIIEAIRFILSRDGWRVDTHSDGKTALEAIHSRSPDLIILDVMLPNRSGYDILNDLRGADETRDVPVLMLTARGQKKDRELAEKLGASRFMTKPFSNGEILDTVRELVG